MPRQFVVSLVGTKDDLVDLREVIKESLITKGYSTLAFDDPGYPYMPGVDPAKRSVDLATLPDVMLLVLDKRYGSRQANRLSVTENEWQRATDNNVAVVPCVRNKALEEFNQWSKTGGTWLPRYVDDVDLLKLIGQVRSSTYLLVFDDAVDLVVQLDKKMRSLTPFMLRRLAQATQQTARNKRTVTVIDQYLSLGDVFDRSLYVTPPYALLSGKTSGHGLEQDVANSLESHQNMIVTGAPGIGKSTALISSLCGRAASTAAQSVPIQLYVDCQFLSTNDFVTVESLVARLFVTALDKTTWPHFDPNDPNLRVELFFDAMDEAIGDPATVQNLMAGSPVWHWAPHLLACRRDFLSRALAEPRISGRYQRIAELQPWTIDHIRLYVERRFVGDVDTVRRLKSTFENSEIVRRLASNVVGLVMLCSLDDFTSVDNAAMLYQAFLEKWIDREAHRANISMKDPELMLATWREIAWQMFIRGRNGSIESSSLPDMFGRFDERRRVTGSPVIQSLLAIKTIGNQSVIAGFIHASIHEYLIAAEVVQRLKGSVSDAAEALKQDTWYEVNEFAQELSSKWNDADCLSVLKVLLDVYQMNLGVNRPEVILARNKACYYVGRLGRQSAGVSADAFDFLNKVWQQERSAFVRQSIGFARSIAGLPGAAKEFIDEMQNDKELDSLNRGYHLAYYGDTKGQVPPYRDLGEGSWQQTRRELVNRLRQQSAAKRNSRLVDLYTLRRFLEDRIETTTEEEGAVIKAIMSDLASYPIEVRSPLDTECRRVIAR